MHQFHWLINFVFFKFKHKRSSLCTTDYHTGPRGQVLVIYKKKKRQNLKKRERERERERMGEREKEEEHSTTVMSVFEIVQT